jgi:Ca2+-transporting ATPase
MVTAIHTHVEGRGRYKVDGLFQCEDCKMFLELRLSQYNGINKVSASALTGNMLVCFNSENTHERIQGLIQDVLKEAKEYFPDSSPYSHENEAGANKDKDSLRQMLKRLLFGPEEVDRSWHLMDIGSVVAELETDSLQGLYEDQVIERLKLYGPNMLPISQPRSGLEIFLDQINSLPVYLLAAAAGVSILTGGFIDAAVIAGVVAANAVIGYFTERHAEKTIQSLKSLVMPVSIVIRGGEQQNVDSDDIVKGDLVLLKPGMAVPADCRIITADYLTIDESILTGESFPVHKNTAQMDGDHIALADRLNIAFMGTLVIGGQGLGLVVATGQHTEVGQLQVMLGTISSPETPIERRLGQLGDQLVVMCAVVCGIVFIVGFIQGHPILQMLRMAISLAAAAVPEGLPAAATINFALGIKKMQRHGVLIRKLQAVETLGALQTICMDKTGTITQNCMAVQKIYSGHLCIHVMDDKFKSGQDTVEPMNFDECQWLFKICALCNEERVNSDNSCQIETICSSPTENALIRVALDAGSDVLDIRKNHKLLKVNHRSESRLFMSAIHERLDGKKILSVKGSPPEVLAMCKWQMIDGELVPLTEESIVEIETENERMAGEALRVLGFAFKEIAEMPDKDSHENGLIWVGIIGMSDPVREGVGDLIKELHRAGIDTIMITGDQHSTAQAVAEKLNLAREGHLEILDSSGLTALEPEVLKAVAKRVHVYSRVSPAHKLQIVQVLQSAGKIVGMTGDGINDGPALKAADIGIAMGRSGTDVAREVADVVLEKDNLETLVIAVRDGRTIHNNVRKSVHFFLSTNLSEIMIMLSSMILGLGVPLNVMQLLWINLVSDIFPAMALSMEEPEADVMDCPPRDPNANLFSNQDYKQMFLESATITTGALAAYGYGIVHYGMGAKASGLAFQSLTLAQLLHAISCRSTHSSIFEGKRPPSNPYLNTALGLSLGVQALSIFFPPLRNFLGIPRLGISDILVIGGSSVSSLLVNEYTKGSMTS